MIRLNRTKFTDELVQVVDQVCSPSYTQMFEKVAKEQPNFLTTEQHIILTHYPNEITWYQGDRRQEIIERIRRTHLKWFNKWLSEQTNGQPPYVEWKSQMLDIILHVTNLLFRMDLGDIITSNDTRNDFKLIADTNTRMLLAINQSNPVNIDPAAIPLVQVLLQILFYLTLDSDLVIYLKSLQLVNLMNEMIRTSNNNNEIHLQAYRILAVIMAETDIKQLQNSSRIATVFITFIKDVIDGGASTEGRLHNSLRSLKVLTQHDEIREELIKQKGDTLLLRCALESQFNPLKAKLPALEILLALAFNKNFAVTLKNNETFMNHVRTLTSSPQQDLQRVATALIWKLEQESETTTKKVEDQSSPASVPTVTKKKYDIMISYSHNDKELCHQIQTVLKKDNLSVWIDSVGNHGAIFQIIAEVIENAEFVLVCMSDAYKQSSFCELEANYAIKRRCHIIPLIMTPNYKADGWLGLLTATYMYIDFPKLGFDKAYEELKKQIGLFRMKDQHSIIGKQDPIHHNTSSIVDEVPKLLPSVVENKEPRPVVEYPHCIDMWTQEHVKSFLLDKKLDVLLSAFEGMNGRLLHKAYGMCLANEQAMFASLKEDIARSQRTTTLSLKDYLTFLEEIKIYIPYKTGDSLNPKSVVCNVM